MQILKIIAPLLLIAVLASCGKKVPQYNPKEIISADAKDTLYFSVKDFMDDQWKNKGHLPYLLTKIVKSSNKTDSAFIVWDSAFYQFRAAFDSTDISSPRFLNFYKFSISKEDALGIYNITYDAENPKLFTQKLVVGVDQENNRVRTLYVETKVDNTFTYRSQKLTYIPDRAIQIQTFNKSTFSKPKETIVVYLFPQGNEEEIVE